MNLAHLISPTLALPSYWAYNVVAYVVIGLFVLAFLITASRDLIRLVLRRGATGTGWGRAWAVARTAMSEAWSSGVWAIVPIWFIACVVLNLLVDPYTESERLGMYVRVMLFGQEIVVLLVMWVLACFSLPRERERRTIITTGSKPLSRLELFLGKIIGFSAVSALLLLSMSVLTYGYLYVQDFGLRYRAQQMVNAQESDWNKGVPGVTPPSDAAKAAAARGRMVAERYVTAPGGVQVAGGIDYTTDPGSPDQEPTRYIKGGSQEQLIYNFQPAWSTGQPPSVVFGFPLQPLEGIPLPPTIELTVSVQRKGNPFQGAMMDRTVALHPDAGVGNGTFYVGGLPLDESLWSYTDPQTGEAVSSPLIVTVKVATAYTYLRILEGPGQAPQSAYITDVDAAKVGSNTMRSDGRPTMVGFEKRDMQQVAGPNPSYPGSMLEVASWVFPAKDLRNVPVHNGKFTLGLVLDRDFSTGADKTIPTEGQLRVYKRYAASDPNSASVVQLTVAEKRMQTVELPAKLLTPDSDLVVDLRTLTPRHWIAVSATSARLLEGDSPYWLNLLKSEAVILMEAVLLITIGVALSVRLGAWVAMLATGMAYILGLAAPFILDILQLGTYTILAPAEAREIQNLMLSRIYDGFLKVGMNISYMVARMMPDFGVFDPLRYIVDGRSMPWIALGIAGIYLILFALPFVALGYLLFRKQELA